MTRLGQVWEVYDAMNTISL